MTERATCSDAEFDMLSWHDNYVHGLQIRGGDHGAGELEPDIDFIVEWVRRDLTPRRKGAQNATREIVDLRAAKDGRAPAAGSFGRRLNGREI